MKHLALLLCLILLFTACAPADPLAEASAELGVDLSAGTLVYSTDTHGGFHGDGETILQIVIPDLRVPESSNWHPLPLSETLEQMLYHSITDEHGHSLLPRIENGCWFFADRHYQSTDPADDSDLFSRHSWNFTAAVYDSDTSTLYFFRIDT